MNFDNYNKIMQATNYAFETGGEFAWDCFPKAQIFDAWNEQVGISVIASPVTGVVYSVTISQYDFGYVWFNSEYREAYFQENKYQGSEDEYYETDCFEDILEKTRAMWNGESFDRDVIMTIELETDVMVKVKEIAEEKGISVEEYVRDLLINYYNEHLRQV